MSLKKKGCVYLVGSGPGDPGLLTLQALRRIQEADLIIYDTLANPEHLRHAKDSAKKICVGKGFRYRKHSQNRTYQLILRAARSGKKVVRLKGGDPYLFGRGGEEALFLVKNHIPFEVVPGVTSATSCAAYAGIPLTHRDHNASVTLLTGHRAHDKDLDSVDWKKIASISGTIAIYMGFYNLKIITQHLAHNGMAPETKVAVIEWGTLPRQKVCSGTLEDIVSLVAEKKLKAPCMIVIGEVVSLRAKLNWFEKRPLFGKKVLITRMRERSASLRERLADLGAAVLEFPTIQINAVSDFKEMDRAIRALSEFQWMIFTSPFGAEAFFKRLREKHKKDVRALNAVKIASVGPETSRALRTEGVLPDLEPKRFEAKGIAEEFKRRFRDLSGQKILLPRADIAPADLEKELKKLGARTVRVAAYRTTMPGSIPAEVKEALAKQSVDFVTFTSASTVDHFVKMMGPKKARSLSGRSKFVSIGPVTSGALKRHKLKIACQAQIFTPDGLAQALVKESKKTR